MQPTVRRVVSIISASRRNLPRVCPNDPGTMSALIIRTAALISSRAYNRQSYLLTLMQRSYQSDPRCLKRALSCRSHCPLPAPAEQTSSHAQVYTYNLHTLTTQQCHSFVTPSAGVMIITLTLKFTQLLPDPQMSRKSTYSFLNQGLLCSRMNR